MCYNQFKNPDSLCDIFDLYSHSLHLVVMSPSLGKVDYSTDTLLCLRLDAQITLLVQEVVWGSQIQTVQTQPLFLQDPLL